MCEKEKQFNDIVEQYYTMFIKLSNKYYIEGYTLDDKMQEIYTKVWSVLDTYDANKAKLSTWLYTIIDNHFQILVRNRNKEKDIIMNGLITHYIPDYESAEILFLNLMSKLNIDEETENILRMYYLQGIPARLIGENIGRSHTYVLGKVNDYRPDLQALINSGSIMFTDLSERKGE